MMHHHIVPYHPILSILSYCYPIASIASAPRARLWTGCVAERQMLVAATSRWCSCMRKAWNTSRQRIAGQEDERWWTIPELEIFMGKSTINGGFSIAMFDYQRVCSCWKMRYTPPNTEVHYFWTDLCSWDLEPLKPTLDLDEWSRRKSSQ